MKVTIRKTPAFANDYDKGQDVPFRHVLLSDPIHK